MTGFSPEEVLRINSNHRFRPHGQIPKIGIWAENVAGAESGDSVFVDDKLHYIKVVTGALSRRNPEATF
jgi:hypothetical protein